MKDLRECSRLSFYLVFLVYFWNLNLLLLSVYVFEVFHLLSYMALIFSKICLV